MWVDGIAEEARWKGEGNNQPNHTTAREVELLYKGKEGSHGHSNIGADPITALGSTAGVYIRD